MTSVTNITRRHAIQSTAGIGALALPAGTALAAVEMPTGTDPHIAWWRERQQLNREIDELESLPHGHGAVDGLATRKGELDSLIVGTPPTTLEGAAIVAAALLWWQDQEEQTPPGWSDIDAEAGGTLARYFLASLPADVLRRGGVASA
jgi:hypothetical protein